MAAAFISLLEMIFILMLKMEELRELGKGRKLGDLIQVAPPDPLR